MSVFGEARVFRSLSGPNFLLVRCGPCADGLTRALGEHGVRAEATESPKEALMALGRRSPDTVIVGHPIGSGPEIVRLLAPHARTGGAVVLALMASAEPEAAVQALAAGADDIVEPPHSASVILLRSRLARARPKLDGDCDGELTLDPRTREVRTSAGRFNLSGREFDLLAYLTDADGTAVPRRTLMEEIWGRSGGSEAVLDATVHRLRKRLEALGLPEETVETVWGIGYRLDSSHLQTANGSTNRAS